MRIVLTRRAAQSGELEEGLRRAGHTAAHMPLTQQVLPADTTELSRTVHELTRGEFDWLVLTSPNTVRALASCGWDGTVPVRTRVAVVGPGTARVLNEVSDARNPWMPKQHSAAGILAELPAPEPEGQLLLPQSAQARPQLYEGLEQRGWNITQVTAYFTTALPHPLVNLSPGDAVLVTSSSAAEVWATLETPDVNILAIGEPTARTLRQLGRPADAVLPEPTAEGALKALAELDR
ncbi:uroporphyrinogen-III synthase [Nesterenkonia natronophila]|uniref:Uroporphyrinogen-III synthase n=1 Tax=Nesterenkonia natronophila TaxID=2174932 RepID=A0A3A4FAE0_9MICC|nr:uroporphyrinogen-III synthase [Nesterenkonia natronophila]RJN31764.1 uroporphyrinogen-III synthase [Nesterenkonia natronophila]